MALYTIGDLHLSADGTKPMNVFGPEWDKHDEKLIAGFADLTEDDVCVICGDLSWGMSIQQAGGDFLFIDSLPGKKIILKGNHDFWWSTASKAKRYFVENDISTIDILNNNCFFYGDYAICGTRGWFYEDDGGTAWDKKIMLREIMRLETSLKAGGDKDKLVFLHYPPIYLKYECGEILELFEKYRVISCCYGHIHGKGCAHAFQGWRGGTEYKLVSADFVDFRPVKLNY